MNLTIQFTSIIASTFIKACTFLFADRLIAIHVGPSYFGIFKYYLTLITLFSVFSSFGYNSSIVRYLSINRKNPSFISSLILFTSKRIILCALLIIIITQFLITYKVFNIKFPDEFQVIIIVLLGFTINMYTIGIYSGLNLSKGKSVINDLVGSLIWFILVYIYSSMDVTLMGLCLIFLLYNLILLVINLIYLRFNNIRLIGNNDSIDQKELIEFKKYSWPIYLTLILIALGSNYDKLILALFENNYLLGIYFSASIFPMALASFLSVVNFLYLPIISSIYANGQIRKFSTVSAWTSKWLSCAAFLFTFILFFHSDQLLLLFFNSEYMIASVSLKILILAQFFHISVGFTGQNLLAMGLSKIQMYIRILTLIFGLVLGIILLKMWSINGLAISVLISIVFSNISQILYITRVKNIRLFYNSNYTIWFLAISIFFINSLISFIYFDGNTMVAQTSIFCLLFILSLFFLGLIGKEDLKLIKTLSREI